MNYMQIMKAQFPPIDEYNENWKLEFMLFTRYRMLVVASSLATLFILASMV